MDTLSLINGQLLKWFVYVKNKRERNDFLRIVILSRYDPQIGHFTPDRWNGYWDNVYGELQKSKGWLKGNTRSWPPHPTNHPINPLHISHKRKQYKVEDEKRTTTTKSPQKSIMGSNCFVFVFLINRLGFFFFSSGTVYISCLVTSIFSCRQFTIVHVNVFT